MSSMSVHVLPEAGIGALAGLTLLAAMLLAGGVFAAPLSEPSLKALRDFAETRDYGLGRPVAAKPTPRGDAILFLRGGPRDPVLGLYELTVATGAVRELVTPADLLRGEREVLSIEELAQRERKRVSLRGFVSYQLSEDGSQVLVSLSGRLYVVRRDAPAPAAKAPPPGAKRAATRGARQEPPAARPSILPLPGEDWIDPAFSPDGRFVAAVRDGELHVIDLAARKSRALTTGATETLTHGLADFAAQEEMDRFRGFWWSPDSRTIAYQETDTGLVEPHFISDPTHPDRPPVSFRYPRAGTANAKVRLGLIAREGGKTTWVRWDAHAYPYLARVVWDEAAAPLTLLVQARDQRTEKILAADARTGATRELWTESDEAWLNLERSASVPRWLPDGTAFLWSTEREGGWQLELRGRDGKRVRALTGVEDGYVGLLDVDEKARTAVFKGGPDAREQHLYRVSLDGGEPVRLTEERGVHEAAFSKGHSVYVDQVSELEGGRRSVVRSDRGERLAELPSVAERPPFAPVVEMVRVRASADRTFDAAIVRPRDFTSGRKYPVILDVYAGPTGKVVQGAAESYLRKQWIADEGYIVVLLDGRGTPGHGREWERAVRGNLIDIALEDQVAGLQALGRTYPELDLSRVGIYGWSFGGYVAAMAVMRRPDIFRCGAAGAPVTDWQEYDTHYTERYMDLPSANPEGYRKTSVLTYVDELQRPLLLIHGLTDDNVYCTHTLKLAEALFKAGKPYELLLLPGTHMLSDPGHATSLWTRVMNFFEAHLGKGTAVDGPASAGASMPSPARHRSP